MGLGSLGRSTSVNAGFTITGSLDGLGKPRRPVAREDGEACVEHHGVPALPRRESAIEETLGDGLGRHLGSALRPWKLATPPSVESMELQEPATGCVVDVVVFPGVGEFVEDRELCAGAQVYPSARAVAVEQASPSVTAGEALVNVDLETRQLEPSSSKGSVGVGDVIARISRLMRARSVR